MIKIKRLAILLALAGSALSAQQILILNDGAQIRGRYEGGNGDTVTFIDDRGNRHRFNVNEIQSLEFNPAPPPQGYASNAPAQTSPNYDSYGQQQTPPPPRPGYDAYDQNQTPPPSSRYPTYGQPQTANSGYDAYGQPQTPPPPASGTYRHEETRSRSTYKYGSDSGAPDPGYADPDVAPRAGWSRQAALPAGTQLVIRTVDSIDTRTPDARRHYLASVERDVVDENGDVVIPRGAMAHLIARDTGNGNMVIDLRSVNVNGQRFMLNAEDITNQREREGIGANRRTGEYVGGGALLGTIIGAIAGGGRGAAIGALAGGAAGAGAQVYTRGRELRVPSETVLTFTLDHPVYLYR